MMNRWVNERFRSALVLVVRQLSSRCNLHLGDQMKVLNENKQFAEVIHLFNEYRTNDTNVLSNMIIMQALKASTHLGDLQHGIAIHQLISTRVQHDSYFAASLIHLYSEFSSVHFMSCTRQF